MALTHAIMTALLDEDMSGYDLAKAFDVSLGFFWTASHQQIYKALKQLQEMNYLSVLEVEQQGKPNKRVYSLNKEGKENLDSWVLSDANSKPTKDELLIKMYNVGHSATASIIQKVERRKLEQQQRLVLYKKIEARHYRYPNKLPDIKKGIYLSLRAGILQSKTTIDWCDESLSLLKTVATY